MPDEPVAYFMTFTTYGTRLHGDPRGSVDAEHNGFGDLGVEPNPVRLQWERRRQKGESVVLTPEARRIVGDAICEVCRVRAWTLVALNVRTNHVHLVVSAAAPPRLMMTSFKAWATRALRQARLADGSRRLWTESGSARLLWRERDVLGASSYTLFAQD